MTVSDYPITLPYGSTVSPYSPSHPHRGRDYGCPSGTPLVVAGRQIGLSGATGNVTGPHTHVQEWNGSYANTREPQNAFKGGTVVNIDPNGTQGDRSFGKFITIQNADGWNDSYCHLSSINCKVGDKIGENMDNVTDADLDILRIIYACIEGGDFNDTINLHKNDAFLLKNLKGSPLRQVIRNMFGNPTSQAYQARVQKALSAPSSLTKDNVVKYVQDNLK